METPEANCKARTSLLTSPRLPEGPAGWKGGMKMAHCWNISANSLAGVRGSSPSAVSSPTPHPETGEEGDLECVSRGREGHDGAEESGRGQTAKA